MSKTNSLRRVALVLCRGPICAKTAGRGATDRDHGIDTIGDLNKYQDKPPLCYPILCLDGALNPGAAVCKHARSIAYLRTAVANTSNQAQIKEGLPRRLPDKTKPNQAKNRVPNRSASKKQFASLT